MDDPAWAWPAWKFGMKRNDLFTTLHDQYNTFSYSIQDPEAFHHDVYEISRDADTTDQFHQMMADRRQMRLRELNESLETLAVEIIANPKLMGTERWHFALQLFRTKSYDSIVRYFASYLPDEYLDRHETHSTSSSFSESDTISTAASSVDDVPIPTFIVDDDFSHLTMTTEPFSMKDQAHDESVLHAPLSPPQSEIAQSELSVSSPASETESQDYSTSSRSRSMSFSSSASGHVPDLTRRQYFDTDFDATSQPDDCDTAVTSVCDSVESPSDIDVPEEDSHTKQTAGGAVHFEDDIGDDYISTAQYPDDDFDYLDYSPSPHDTLDSDSPTPRPEATPSCFLDVRSIISSKIPCSHKRSSSPISFIAKRESRSPVREMACRRSPEESSSRIQKPVLDFTKRRPNARRRID